MNHSTEFQIASLENERSEAKALPDRDLEWYQRLAVERGSEIVALEAEPAGYRVCRCVCVHRRMAKAAA